MSQRSAPPLEHHTLELYENIWLGIGFLIQLVLFLGVVAGLVSQTSPRANDNTTGHNHLEGVKNGRVDPTKLDATVFAKPGLHRLENGSYQAVVVAKAFNFDPPFLKVPANTDIVFHVTAADVLHGYYVLGTNINFDLMPGQVTSFKTRFSTPGEYNVICNEYCGIGHHNMINRVVVEPAGTEVPTVQPTATESQQ